MGALPGPRGGRLRNIRGLVLAGGKSSRFGEDKAQVFYKGMTFLERAVSLLNGLRLKPVVVTRHGKDYPMIGCPVIHDRFPGKGPLGGIYTAMDVFKETAFLVLTCDMPDLTGVVLSDLLKEHRPEFSATVYRIGTQLQPFPGIYEPSLLVSIRAYLKEEKLAMRDLLDLAPAKQTIIPRCPREVFNNINYKRELSIQIYTS